MYILHGTKDGSLSNFKMCEISVKIRVYGYNEVIMNWRLVTSHLSVRGLSRKKAYCVTKPSKKVVVQATDQEKFAKDPLARLVA